MMRGITDATLCESKDPSLQQRTQADPFPCDNANDRKERWDDERCSKFMKVASVLQGSHHNVAIASRIKEDD